MTATRHAVADLLTDEMRARVRAAKFEQRSSASWIAPTAVVDGVICCPLAVAFGLRGSPSSYQICRALGWPDDDHERVMLADFINNITRELDPADVCAALGADS